jgi:crotonobetainyl-CoA:carnitine CoA-transferase CaiB-like acyl-CoA transferase
MTNEALAGVKVVAFEIALAGPMTTSILASYGAEVIKVESRTRIDWMRQIGPFIGGERKSNEGSVCYLVPNAGKFDLSLDLKHPRAMEVMTRLVEWADVVAENFAGGVITRLGLGYEELRKIKPDIIMLSSSIYGQTGSFAQVPGYGAILTALTGLSHLTGFPDQLPQAPGFAITDFIAPRINVLAIVAALEYRRRTGKGQYIDTSQMETIIPLLTPVLLEYGVNGKEASRMGNRSTRAAPHGVYQCKGNDRWCAIAVFIDEEWQQFCQVINNPAWTEALEFSTLTERVKNAEKLDALVEEWTINYTPEEVMKLMQDAGVAAGVVQCGQDLDNDPQLKRQSFFQKFDHPGLGGFSYSGMPAQLSKTPYEVKRAPFLGEHTEYICTQVLGFSDKEFVQLVADRVLE